MHTLGLCSEAVRRSQTVFGLERYMYSAKGSPIVLLACSFPAVPCRPGRWSAGYTASPPRDPHGHSFRPRSTSEASAPRQNPFGARELVKHEPPCPSGTWTKRLASSKSPACAPSTSPPPPPLSGHTLGKTHAPDTKKSLIIMENAEQGLFLQRFGFCRQVSTSYTCETGRTHLLLLKVAHNCLLETPTGSNTTAKSGSWTVSYQIGSLQGASSVWNRSLTPLDARALMLKF